MTPFLPLLLLLFLSATSATDDIHFRLYRFGDEHERMTILAHAGHPERLLPLTLSFTVPVAFHSDALWTESATQGDLPGLYAAIFLLANDPIRFELSSTNLPQGLMALPTLQLESLGSEHFWSVNVTSDPSSQLGIRPSGKSRGFFMLGSGSAVWLKSRYAKIGRSELTLSDTLPKQGPATVLPCNGRDSAGRCILTSKSYTLRYHLVSGKTETETIAGRVLIDLDSYATTLPMNASGRLRHGSMHTSDLGAVVYMDWGIAKTNFPLARASDVLPTALQDEAGPAYVVDGGASQDLVLGRELLTRLFSEMTYDSSEAVWIMTSADTSATYTEGVRWTLAILLVVQAFLVGRQLLSPTHLMLTHVLTPTLQWRSVSRLKDGSVHVLPVYYSVGLVVVAVLQLILGQIFVGTGFGVDPLRAGMLTVFGWWNLGLACGFFALLLASWTLMMKRDYHWSFEFFQNIAYVNLGLNGLMAALLPRAVQGQVELILLGALIVLQIFLLSYVILSALVMLIVRRHMVTSKSDPRKDIYEYTNLLWYLVLVGAIILYILLAYAGTVYVLDETVREFNTQHDDAANWLYATIVLGVTFIGSGFLVLAESHNCFDTKILSDKKKQG